MDIDNWDFERKLGPFFQDLVKAHFVAFDFEFSGIHLSAKDKKGIQSLEDRYQEIKAAAENYTIVQAGITLGMKNEGNGSFELKPFNFNVTPITQAKQLNNERNIVFQASAMEFLIQNNFNFQNAFHNGCHYLSRADEDRARNQMLESLDRSKIADMDIKDDDTSTFEFLKNLRERVEAWETELAKEEESQKNKPKKKRKNSDGPRVPNILYINTDISPHYPAQNTDPYSENHKALGLTAFHRRLVYQTIRNEYPHLQAFTRDGAMCIKKTDSKEEEQHQKKKREDMERNLIKQIGFRWIIEALCASAGTSEPAPKDDSSEDGIPRSRLDAIPSVFFVDRTDDYYRRFPDSFKFQWQNIRRHLTTHPPVLVGHNCFMDLTYMYATFIGPLPSTSQEFISTIHGLFPAILDTKYMSTAQKAPSSNLEALPSDQNLAFPANFALYDTAAAVEKRSTVEISLSNRHTKYEMGKKNQHEAGYDSMITARLFIQLSTLLGQKPATGEIGCDDRSPTSAENGSDVDGGVSLVDGENPPVAESGDRQDDGSMEVDGQAAKIKEKPTMPEFADTVFWERFSNRVRIFGTQEEMVHFK